MREERNDRNARVSTNNNDVLINWVCLLDLGNEAGSADNIEGGNTEETVWFVDSLGLENLGDNWDGAVDWVGDNEDVGIWGRLCGSLCEVSDDGCVGVEEIVAGHAWLSWDTSWDENNLCALESGGETAGCWVISGNLALGVDVGDIGGDTW